MKHPAVIAALIGAVLLIVGGLMSWLDLSGSANALVGGIVQEANSLVGTKMSMALWIGIIGLLFVLLAGYKAKKGFLVVNVILGLIVLLPLATAYIKPTDPGADLLGIKGMAMGYYIAWIGALLLLIGSIAGVVMMKKVVKKA